MGPAALKWAPIFLSGAVEAEPRYGPLPGKGNSTSSPRANSVQWGQACKLGFAACRQEPLNQGQKSKGAWGGGKRADNEEGDADRDATFVPDVPIDQWEHENAAILKQNSYGFGLIDDLEFDDTKLFDESGIQPNGTGMISWDVVLKNLVAQEMKLYQCHKNLQRSWKTSMLPVLCVKRLMDQ
eukprot:985491-Amphidinium_carterae.2